MDHSASQTGSFILEPLLILSALVVLSCIGCLWIVTVRSVMVSF